MTKRLVEIDDDLLADAQKAAGASTIKETVAVALTRLVAEDRRKEAEVRRRWARAADAVRDLHDPDVMSGAWS
ncbi:MAG: type II toxin-antitoxin system VapB family antitoxin [Egibacteraceae bacterium]